MKINIVNDEECFEILRLECDCMSLDHSVRFLYDKEYKFLHIENELQRITFFQRLIDGFKFIFMGGRIWFHTINFKQKDIEVLIKFLQEKQLEMQEPINNDK